MATCELCEEPVGDEAVLWHLRLFHPDEYGNGPDCWPDGTVVVVDQTDYTAQDVAVEGGTNE